MSTHTPGPWRVVPFREGDSPGICSADGVHVCNVDGYGTLGETDSINARLIASAPDLLAACREALALLEDPDSDQFGADAVEARLRAVITQAEGGGE